MTTQVSKPTIEECRETLEAAGVTGLSDDEVAYLRYVLAQVARLRLRQRRGVEVEIPADWVSIPSERARPRDRQGVDFVSARMPVHSVCSVESPFLTYSEPCQGQQ
jgi:hypothetical protein